MGGKDSASPRYIFTYLEPIADKMFRKEDLAILKYNEDDGMSIEPENYLPTRPLLLVNGCVGIGTGFSTDIPPYNPADLISLLRQRLEGNLDSLRDVVLKPWWQGFKGAVNASSDTCWITKGCYTMDEERHTVTITELPVGVWTKDYKGFLDEMCTAASKEAMKDAFTDDGLLILKSFDDLYTDEEVKFVLNLSEDYCEEIKAHPEDFEKRFRLTSSWRTTNMVAFDPDLKIVRYSTAGHILEAFYGPRLAAYEVRRVREIERLGKEAVQADAVARFIRAVLEGSLELRRATDEDIVRMMVAHALPALSAGAAGSVDCYEYLLRLRMDRVKASAITDAERYACEARAAVEELENTTAGQLWLKDLGELETAFIKQGEVRAAAMASAPKKKVLKKKA
jgi:DNA topoisomerase-2